MRKLKVLIACESSGEVREAFTSLGHDAVSCDIKPSERQGRHIQGDAVEVLKSQAWDLLIAHPPCTRLCNSGVCWLDKRGLWGELDAAAAFFRVFLEADVQFVAVENPIPHRYAVERIGRSYDQKVQPWWFGHGETKATCFWLKNLPPLMATQVMPGREQRLHRLPPGPERATERSRTYPGIAKAMAEQWSAYILSQP